MVHSVRYRGVKLDPAATLIARHSQKERKGGSGTLAGVEVLTVEQLLRILNLP